MLTADQMIITGQQQLGAIMQHSNLVLGCCERLTEESMRSARALLAQVESDFDALLRGETIGFINAAGRIGLDSWASMTACVIATGAGTAPSFPQAGRGSLPAALLLTIVPFWL